MVFADASVDPYNGKCVRASAGSLFHLPVAVGRPGRRRGRRLRGAGLRMLAADGAARRTWTQLDDGPTWAARPPGCSATRPGGCRDELLALADEVVRGARSTAGPRA